MEIRWTRIVVIVVGLLIIGSCTYFAFNRDQFEYLFMSRDRYACVVKERKHIDWIYKDIEKIERDKIGFDKTMALFKKEDELREAYKALDRCYKVW